MERFFAAELSVAERLLDGKNTQQGGIAERQQKMQAVVADLCNRIVSRSG
jgi:hypothetical protein